MSIVVQCPHCETKFNLQREMIGRSMRCPNLDCRQTFIVKDTGRPIEPLPPLPDEPSPPKPKPRPAAPAKPEVVEAEIVEAAVVAPPKVKEVVWSAGKDVPPKGKGRGKKPVRAEVEDDTPPARRKKQKNRRPWLLIGMSVAVVLLLGFGGFYILNYQSKAEEALAQQAKKEYDDTSYAMAAKTYAELVEKYPESAKAADYRFFADLASLQVVVRTLTGGDNPEATIGRLKSFIQAHRESPLAQHTSGYGRDIHEAGRKLGDDVVAHAGERVKKFRADRAKNAGELPLAEKSVAAGRELLPLLAPFRGPDERPLDKVRDGLDDAEKQVKHEYARTAALAKAAAQLEKVTDAMIQAAETDLAAAGFLDDPDAQSMIATAKGRLREMVKFEAMEAAPRDAPKSLSASVVFVTPVGPTRRAPPAVGVENVAPSVFLCVARGILYALDEETGTLLWAVRVGAEVTDQPTVTRAALATGPTDLALVASNVGGEPALVAYVVRTGEARWYQPLPAPAAGPAVVVGSRGYLALGDPEGSVYEFDVTSGTRRGRIRLGQPAGPGLVVRPGTGLLYAAADARRVFVIDAGAKDDGGAPIPPRCVQVISTRHGAGTLRTPPVLIGPEGDDAGERWMVLPQTDGKLRAFALPPIQPPPADGSVPLESAATPAAELPLDGWVWFPPASDGERLALVTDRGEFRVFGVNQPGNFDKAIFPLPSPTLAAPPAGTAVRGLVLPAGESAFWVLANGTVQKFRVANIPTRTLEVVEDGTASSIGEPTQPPQLNNRRDAACLVVRSQTSGGCKAALLNLATGELRWQRQLGVIPAAPPIPQEGVVVLASEDGGLVAVPGTGAAPGQTTVAPPAWVIGVPPENATGPTRVALSADGKTAYTVTPVAAKEEGKPVAKYVIRRVAGGRVVHEGIVASPGAIAGAPVVLGESLLIAAADGFVHRHIAGTSRANPDTLTAGPPWSSGPRGAAAECSITPTSDTAFLTSDGDRQLKAWSWPKTGSYSQGAGKWELRDRPAGPGVLLPPLTAGDSPRILIADVSGTVRLYAGDRGGEHLRQWRPGGGHPTGRPGSPPVVQADAAGRPVVAFTVEDRSLVCLDPEKDGLKWVVRLGDEADATLVGAPQPAGAGRWLVTDLGGRVTLYDADGGKSPPLAVAMPGAVPARAAGSVGGSGILAPLSDGSAVVLTPPAGSPPAPAPKPKE